MIIIFNQPYLKVNLRYSKDTLREPLGLLKNNLRVNFRLLFRDS